MNPNAVDDSDVFLIAGVIMCSFEHWGAGMLLIFLGCLCGMLGSLTLTRP